MKENLTEFIEQVRKIPDLMDYDEMSTYQTIIQPIFHYLGWDIFNRKEVFPQFPIEGKKVDYALRINDSNKVFVEVKRPREDLDNHEYQLINYAFSAGVKIACLTNGIIWRLYLPLNEGNWKERRFFTAHILEQEINLITDNLLNYLSRESIKSGKAIERATSIIEDDRKKSIIQKAMLEVWNIILKEPDEELITLISKKTESNCGYRPEKDMVIKFIHELYIEMSAYIATDVKSTNVQIPTASSDAVEYTGTKPKSFNFMGEQVNVSSYKELLVKVLGMVYKKHSKDFHRVLGIKGRTMTYFSTNKEDIKYTPQNIPDSKFWVESTLDANSIVYRLLHPVLKLFNYDPSSLVIITKEDKTM